MASQCCGHAVAMRNEPNRGILVAESERAQRGSLGRVREPSHLTSLQPSSSIESTDTWSSPSRSHLSGGGGACALRGFTFPHVMFLCRQG